MTGTGNSNFMIARINYDFRESLGEHEKYTTMATLSEHNQKVRLFEEFEIGGLGFHECVNFKRLQKGIVRFYLPPGYIPVSGINGEYCIFYLTYKNDVARPHVFVGVHAFSTIVNGSKGFLRDDVKAPKGFGELRYYGEAKAKYSTTFYPAVPFQMNGRHFPSGKRFGSGFRYLSSAHAKNILQDALNMSASYRKFSNREQQNAIDKQLTAIEAIYQNYFNKRISTSRRENLPKSKRIKTGAPLKGQGFPKEHEQNKVIDEYAMKRAIQYFQSKGFLVEDTSKSNSYDLRITKETETRTVEVKGTRSEGKSILLTPNEVTHAQSSIVDLIVISKVVLEMGATGLHASGGAIKVVQNWKPKNQDLTPLGFKCAVP